jgi:thymidylate synthase (FAD)
MTEEAPIPLTFRSDMTVQLVRAAADDPFIAQAARVSTLGDKAVEDAAAQGIEKLINFLIRDRHGSPFEHCSFTFYVEAPIFVWREIMRHRMASYNEESGRYKVLRPIFYVPAAERNLVQQGKPGAYEYVAGTEEQHAIVNEELRNTAETAYAGYQRMLDAEVAREVSRMGLPLNIYSSAFVTMNTRALTNFLSLRTKRPLDEAKFPSFPQREIEMVADMMEASFAEYMPITQEAWNRHGRVPI